MSKLQSMVSYMEKIVSEEGVYLAILYRIDGTPAIAKIKSEARGLAKEVVSWMEREIKYVLPLISREKLESVIHEMGRFHIIFYPVTDLMVLAVAAEEEVHRQKLMIDIASTKESIREYLVR